MFDSVAYRIASGTVLVYAVVKAGLPAGWYNDKVTGLPSKIKPYMQVMGSHRIASAADAAKDIFASLNTDSTVQVYISAATNAAVAFTFTYPFG